MRRIAWLLLALCPLVTGGCSLFSKKDRPIDVGADAPSAQILIDAVQNALDKTATSPAWSDQIVDASAQKRCEANYKRDKDEYQDRCGSAYGDAHKECSKLTGNTASVVCADLLSRASATCGTAPIKACAFAGKLAAVKLKSAKLTFAATSAKNAGGEVSLKLISAKQAREYGRASSFEIELVPRQSVTRKAGEKTAIAMDDLTALIWVALNTASKCQGTNTGSPSERRNNCTEGAAAKESPELTFSKATYTLDVSYTRTTGGKFLWSVSSLKLNDGMAEAGESKSLRNTLTLELYR